MIAPALIPRRVGNRVKTDRRDAGQLAVLYRAGALTPIHIPTEQEEAVRDLLRCREDICTDLLRAKHRLSKFLLRHGRRCPDGRAWSKRYFAWLSGAALAAAGARADLHVVSTGHRRHRRAAPRGRCRSSGRAHRRAAAPRVARLRCFRGIDDLTALTIAVELGDATRFPAARQVMGFTGLVPSEYSSGATQKRGGITKTGNAHLRRVLVEAAWHYRHRPAISHRVRVRQHAGAARRDSRGVERAASAARALSTPARPREITPARGHGGRARIVGVCVGGVDAVIGSAEMFGRILETSMR